LVNEDITRSDGVVRCRELTTKDFATVGWRLLRLIKIFRDFPIPF
jgi:hypothetical protein